VDQGNQPAMGKSPVRLTSLEQKNQVTITLNSKEVNSNQSTFQGTVNSGSKEVPVTQQLNHSPAFDGDLRETEELMLQAALDVR
jgi:hypothetical protein